MEILLLGRGKNFHGGIHLEHVMKPIGQGMLRRALHEYVTHYHLERNHQGLGNEMITPRFGSQRRDGPITRRPRLGGVLNYYERLAA